MDLVDVRSLPARELAFALDELGIGPGWEFGDLIRATSFLASTDPPALPDPMGRVQPFQNLVVGTIAERAFRDHHLAPLEPSHKVIDYHARGENRDFGVQKDGVELPINVKVASTRFREAKKIVGLDADDCIPIGAYKAIGASEKVPELIYVFLVDFDLRARVDAFMDSLEGPLVVVWHLLSWYAGKGGQRAQDRYNDSLFEEHASALMALAPEVSSYRAISAQRALSIMRRMPRRVPGLGVPAAGTGVIRGEVNIHVSVKHETTPWTEVAHALRRNGIEQVLSQISRTTITAVPDPAL